MRWWQLKCPACNLVALARLEPKLSADPEKARESSRYQQYRFCPYCGRRFERNEVKTIETSGFETTIAGLLETVMDELRKG